MSILLLLSPLFALSPVIAATTDFTAGANITVSDVTFSGSTTSIVILDTSTAETWSFSNGLVTVINPGTFKVSASNSSVASLRSFIGDEQKGCQDNTTPGTTYLTFPTTAGTYKLELSVNSCQSGGGGSTGGGGGGGGGGSPVVTTTVTTPAQTTTTTPAPTTTSAPSTTTTAPSAGSALSSEFGLGATGTDVVTLQNFLEGKGLLTMPAGIAKGTFGALTRTAVRAYQSSVGISATGYIGPKTLSAINADGSTSVAVALSAPSTTTTAPSPAVASAFERNLTVGMQGDDVRALQVYLNANGYTVADSGPGSSGSETTMFGAATRAALIKLQEAAGITPTAGYFGAKTREYLNANP